jgi:hypothetical protein
MAARFEERPPAKTLKDSDCSHQRLQIFGFLFLNQSSAMKNFLNRRSIKFPWRFWNQQSFPWPQKYFQISELLTGTNESFPH